MPKILSLGSLNLDLVYRLPHTLVCGETVSSLSRTVGPGGKGGNQSVACAKAGVRTLHFGRVGRDGSLLLETLKNAGVETAGVEIDDTLPSGHAVILVDDKGANTIVLDGAANQSLSPAFIDRALNCAAPGDVLLLQNEINPDALRYAITAGKRAGLAVALNFAPADAALAPTLELNSLRYLFVNEIEGAMLAHGTPDAPETVFAALRKQLPDCEIVMTLGADGVLSGRGNEFCKIPAFRVKPVDTTAAGDTFIGYYLAKMLAGAGREQACRTGCAASALTVQRKGASASIPRMEEVRRFEQSQMK